MTSLLYLSSEIHAHYTSILNISLLRLYNVHRDGDIEMSDNTAYSTTHHTSHVTCADESQYEDVNINYEWLCTTTLILQLLTINSNYINEVLLKTVLITS